MSNPQQQWDEIDTNNGGKVLFDEFCNWAIKKGLDLEDDDDEDLELDQALKKFEQGVKLSRECQKTLEDAEMKIKILMDGELKDTDQTLDQ